MPQATEVVAQGQWAGGEMADLPTGRQARLNKLPMYYTYVLRSISRKYIYVGLTGDLQRRVSEHQEGKERTTAPYRPFELVLQEHHPTRPAAREREKYLKSGSGKEWIKREILGRMQ